MARSGRYERDDDNNGIALRATTATSSLGDGRADSVLIMAARHADEQPLLDGQAAADEHGSPGAHVGGSSAWTKPPAGPGLYVWMLTLSAGVSGLLFGYDTGVISAMLVTIGPTLTGRPLTSLDKSVVTSATALFALLASPAASVVADARGRRRVLLAADALFVAGALIQAASRSVAALVAGRAVVGAAVGAASFVTPLYIAEAAPAAHRGRLVTVNVLFITLGQVAAYVLGWLLAARADPRSAWRWMVGLGALPALVQALLVLPLPESPRWLVQAGRRADARAVLARVQGPDAAPAATAALLATIEAEVRAEADAKRRRQQAPSLPPAGPAAALGRWAGRRLGLDGDAWTVLFAERRNRRALAIACLLQGLQQLCGFNSLMYFSATIFALVGFAQPTLTALTVAATNFVFTVVALLVVDRIGRRRVLLVSMPAMAAGLLLAAYGFSRLDLAVGDGGERVRGGGGGGPGPDPGAAALVLASIMLYVAAYALGLGNVPWMQSELFALDVRSLGSGLATATNWLANFVVGLTFLPLMDALTPAWTFVLYAAVCLAGVLLVRACYPETSGLSLEAAARLLAADDWGVHRRPATRP